MKFKLQFFKQYTTANGKSTRRPSLLQVITALVFILAMAYVLYTPPKLSIEDPGIQAGDIVKEDIIIARDITVEDRESTDQKRQKAIENIIPVYEYNTGNQEKLRSLLNDWYQTIRQSRKQFIKNRNDLPAINSTIEKKFGIQMENSRLRYILRANPFGKIGLDPLLLFLNPIQDTGILASKVGAKKSKNGTIQVVAKQSEPAILPVDQFFDLKDVETALTRFLKTQKVPESESSLLSSVLMEFIDVNLAHSLTLTRKEEERVSSEINPVIIRLKAGKVILRKGDEVRPEDLKILGLIASAEEIHEARLPRYYLIVTIIGFLYFFLNLLFKVWKSSNQNREKLFLVTGATLFVGAMVYRGSLFLFPLILKNISIEVPFTAASVFFAIPFGFGALIIAFTFDLQSAVLFSFINSIIAGIVCGWDFRIVIYVLLGNMVVSYGIEYYQRIKRSPILKSSVIWLLPTNLFYILILNFTEADPGVSPLVFNLLMGTFSAIMAPILATFIIPLWETLFKLITDLKLIELNNLNLPIFREMLEKAPGTYHHSQMVATLSETAALDLGLSPLFLTSMALYHDVGKIENPQFFTENNTLYPEDPHKKLPPTGSAKMIISHISEGTERAKKLKLPVVVAAAIQQHHGTKLVRFFYDKAMEGPEVQTDDLVEKNFRYSGEKPQTIENAIIMLADQVEAASKSLASPSDEEIRNIIQSIIDDNIEEKQFDECDGLTFKALNTIANGFLKKLSSIYHMRVSYPGFNFKETNGSDDHNS